MIDCETNVDFFTISAKKKGWFYKFYKLFYINILNQFNFQKLSENGIYFFIS